MNSQQYLDEMKKIQQNLLDFLDNERDEEEIFQNLKTILDDLKICDNQNQLKSLLYLLSKISNNHHRGPNFFNKIEKILLLFKNDIKKFYSNWDIFFIFKENKRMILFLINEQIINIDKQIARKFATPEYEQQNYSYYFVPELKPFVNEYYFRPRERLLASINGKIPENFNELRRIGENDSKICQLIREDLINDFIEHVNQNNISLDTTIRASIFETNPFLLQNSEYSLIQYAAFFGSIQIFKYLCKEGIQLKPSLWLYAIHGQNAEIIHFLEDKNIDFNFGDKYKIKYQYDEIIDEKKKLIINKPNMKLIKEAIKCHHNDIANHLFKFFDKKDELQKSFLLDQNLKFYNFAFVDNDFINESAFTNLCKYDYYSLSSTLLEQHKIDINKRTIFILILMK